LEAATPALRRPGTDWVAFEANSESIWKRLAADVYAFLLGLWRDGGLQGMRPEEASFVRCDHSTMTQDDIDNGRSVCLVGVAAVQPAEFVIFRVTRRIASR